MPLIEFHEMLLKLKVRKQANPVEISIL